MVLLVSDEAIQDIPGIAEALLNGSPDEHPDIWQVVYQTVHNACADLQRPLILIDGRSGSGKSTFATYLATGFPTVELLRMDQFYPGWHGLTAATEMLHTEVLGANHRYQTWDWERDRPGEWHTIQPDVPLIVEGCGAITRALAEQAAWTVWCDGPASWRYRRAITRDGDMFEPFWETWAKQEDTHIEANNPMDLADLRLCYRG